MFTNDDLKRLRDGLAGPDDAWFDGYSVKTIKALRSRLEAAENCMQHNTCECAYCDEATIAWRKACGSDK